MSSPDGPSPRSAAAAGAGSPPPARDTAAVQNEVEERAKKAMILGITPNRTILQRRIEREQMHSKGYWDSAEYQLKRESGSDVPEPAYPTKDNSTVTRPQGVARAHPSGSRWGVVKVGDASSSSEESYSD